MARDFPPDEAIFLQEYSGYCKKKWCPAGGKDPLFGRVDGFQIDPNDSGEFCIPVGTRFSAGKSSVLYLC